MLPVTKNNEIMGVAAANIPPTAIQFDIISAAPLSAYIEFSGSPPALSLVAISYDTEL